jgi:hypothetical protein
VINVKKADQLRQFFFPKSILISKGVLSTNMEKASVVLEVTLRGILPSTKKRLKLKSGN